ncbi:MAG: hypothetical protein V7K38_21565 [Nostoc sp.]|uniref:hypothetical protein n=1 Tax=Nostoc sp. TaxID=1180 RepID=UPI002FFCCDF7
MKRSLSYSVTNTISSANNSITQPLIPVSNSILDGAALITTVLCNYVIFQPHSWKLYKRGLNDTYLVETEEDSKSVIL